MQLLVEGTNLFSGGIWPEGMDDTPSSVGDVTLPGMFLVLAVSVHMLHDIMGL
jgi:hypothetical protein